MLITYPGFSTKKMVTSVSGRGVGMDSVRTKVESFGGVLRIESKPNLGSKFILKLPLMVAIIPALLVKLESQIYAIPLTNIIEVIKGDFSLIKKVENWEVIPYRDTVLPLIRLKEKFNLVSSSTSSVFFIVVVEVGSKKVGLLVDELIGQQEIVIKNLGRLLRDTEGISGATILGDGKVVMILDIFSLI
jgi:two-component system chemotaxis sensor kinase CheA